MLKNGAPGVCTAKSDQKPPKREKGPPVRACGLASGCPRVPLTANLPPVLVPPPPPITEPSIEYVCAWAPVPRISNPTKSTVPENVVANERNVFRHGFGRAGMGKGDIKRACFVFIVRPWGSSYATSTRHSLFCAERLQGKLRKSTEGTGLATLVDVPGRRTSAGQRGRETFFDPFHLRATCLGSFPKSQDGEARRRFGRLGWASQYSCALGKRNPRVAWRKRLKGRWAASICENLVTNHKSLDRR